MLERIMRWGIADPDVRGLALTGSRAGPVRPDHLADIDIQVYARSVPRFEATDDWVEALGPAWVRVHDEYRDGEARVPTRLVIFAGGVKVDFALYEARSMSGRIDGPFSVRVLLDKDGAAMPAAPRAATGKRGQKEFTGLVEEFWFEAYHVGKYLARGDSWPARSRHEATLARLLSMLEWRHELQRGSAPPSDGKAVSAWADDLPRERLFRLYPAPVPEESWQALFEAIEIFRASAREVAIAAGFRYAEDVDRNLSGFLAGLRRESAIEADTP
ncbi:MAG TPA: aminoglycoside 6-adenylyltransferase [Gemmatimonadota bacterium]|nr:aminoglycoside 6-adenylyltransferase [Gemmatimonadota bacterium]